ncbi:hypothetical protein ACFPAG_08620 [Vogesella sp. GCM10023246]|uniref:Uncharacterized protein n=1 Tax=Vogesella oryzagri TaxID=3160864 RepID=A0ABV1M3A2_9NEIS
MWDWLLGSGHPVSRQDVEGAVEMLVEQVEPRLRLLPDGRRKLRRGVKRTLQYMHELCETLPESLDLSLPGYSLDRRVGLLFSSPQSLSDILAGSESLHDYFARPSSADTVQLMLSMQPSETHRLGSMLMPDGSIRKDVPQTILSFDRHRFIAAGSTRDEAVRKGREHAYAVWCASLGQGMQELEARRRLLEIERQALQLQLKTGAGVLNAEALNLSGVLTREQAGERLEQVQRELADGSKLGSLAGKLQLLQQIVEGPEEYIKARQDTVWVNRMGVLTPPDQGGQQLDYAEVLLGYVQQRRRVVFPATLSRDAWREWQQRWPQQGSLGGR